VSDNKRKRRLCLPTFIFGRDRANFYVWQNSAKTLFTAKHIEPSMNATSSHVPTAKSGFGCQKKSLARSLSKIKVGTIPAKNKNKHDCA
jgi:hypothetical protein